MGTPKLLLPLGGEPLVRRAVRQVCEAGFDETVVVVGSESPRVLAALEDLPVRAVLNDAYATGMGSSFRTAVVHLGRSDAAMFALADQPFLTAAEYRLVLEAHRRCPGGIVCARYGDVTAPPHIFDRAFFPELAALEHGARPVLERHRDRISVVELAADLLLDIDTPEDYELARSRLSAGR